MNTEKNENDEITAAFLAKFEEVVRPVGAALAALGDRLGEVAGPVRERVERAVAGWRGSDESRDSDE